MTELLITPHAAVDGRRRLHLAGEVDYATVEQLCAAIETAITAERTAELVVDLGAVTFLDSGGISALIQGRRIADAHGVAYRVINPTGPVRQVLTLTGVLEHLAGEAH